MTEIGQRLWTWLKEFLSLAFLVYIPGTVYVCLLGHEWAAYLFAGLMALGIFFRTLDLRREIREALAWEAEGRPTFVRVR